jgi:phage terminase large subunit-like protein
MNQTTAPRIEATDPSALSDPVVQQEIAQISQAIEANPLWGYRPHPKQLAFHSAKVRLRVYFGGSRSGKTAGGVVDDVIQCIDKESVPEHLKRFKRFEPPCRIRIVVPGFELPLKAIEETILRWCPKFELKGGSWEEAWNQRNHTLKFGNGSFIEIMSYEQDRAKFGGVTRDRIHYDEEPDGEKGQIIREECQTRLMEVKGSDEIFTFTPLEGLGWTFDEFEEQKGPEIEKNVWLDEKMLVVRASVRDNPAIPDEEIDLRLGHLPELRRRAREDGEFLHLEGLVYPMFDKDLHCVNDTWLRSDAGKDHVQHLELHEIIDPGYNTTAVLFAGIDPENRFLIYDELYLTEKATIPENAAQHIREKRNAWGYGTPVATLIDPSARNHSLTGRRDPNSDEMTPDTVRMAYYRAGIPTVKANNDKEGGVFEVMRRLENRDKEGEPDPLLLIGENCSSFLRELRRYRLKPKDDGSFDVVKREDHGPDCLRYLCNHRPLSRPKAMSMTQRRPEQWDPGVAPPVSTKPAAEPVGPLGRFA